MLILYAVAFKLFFACHVLSQDTCRILEFIEPEAGSYLEHHVIQNTSVDNNGQCEINCYVEKLCFSFNLGMPESGDKLICELSDSDHYQHPGDLVSKKGFSYHPTAKLCGGLACPHAASCLPNQQGNLRIRCVCPAHWPKITNCERGVPFHWTLNGSDPLVSLYNGSSYNTTDGRTVLYLDGDQRSYAQTPDIPIQKISFSLLCWVKF
ncbi:hypothetical protein OS493_016946 [Desmophyllum pertusum]|uniref:Apple domain-containing protein n=1 Tax=Desmophyllum pertusum TaxID=174260 RepID=A0A9W9YQ26_9CNID|nr:hypothetical protein OS493_016946 [Desmophyllum pertusum]